MKRCGAEHNACAYLSLRALSGSRTVALSRTRAQRQTSKRAFPTRFWACSREPRADFRRTRRTASVAFRCARARCLLVVCKLALPAWQQTRSQHGLVCPEPGYPELVEQTAGDELDGKRKRCLAIQALPRVVVGVGAYGGHVKGCEGLEARSLGQDLPELDVILLAATPLARALRAAVVDPAARGRWKRSSARWPRSYRIPDPAGWRARLISSGAFYPRLT